MAIEGVSHRMHGVWQRHTQGSSNCVPHDCQVGRLLIKLGNDVVHADDGGINRHATHFNRRRQCGVHSSVKTTFRSCRHFPDLWRQLHVEDSPALVESKNTQHQAGHQRRSTRHAQTH